MRRLRLALALLAVPAGVAAVAGASAGGDGGRSRATGCRAEVDRGVLPSWARTGFSDPRPRIAHVLGRSGRIVAILFADPLLAPPARDRANKILWVPRVTPQGPLRFVIRASHGDLTVTRVLPTGPGPSYVDLPEPGCWRLRLRWGTLTHPLRPRHSDKRRPRPA